MGGGGFQPDSCRGSDDDIPFSHSEIQDFGGSSSRVFLTLRYRGKFCHGQDTYTNASLSRNVYSIHK